MDIPKLDVSTPILGTNDLTVANFWSWAYSDILSNRNRAIFAEYLVASALGVTDNPRIEWDAVDLRYNNISIEVKSASYIQAWEQDKLSSIIFDIAKKKSWDAETNTYNSNPTRSSDIYVFCLLAEKDKNKIDVLNIEQWQFYVLSNKYINDNFAEVKSMSLKKLEGIDSSVRYECLKSKIEEEIK